MYEAWWHAGMDFYVMLERPGYRVARRRRVKSRIGRQHKVTKEDAIKWCVAARAVRWAEGSAHQHTSGPKAPSTRCCEPDSSCVPNGSAAQRSSCGGAVPPHAS